MPRVSEWVLALVISLAAAPAAAQQAMPAEAVNASRPTRCAEEDNVYIKFRSPRVRAFVVEAAHPRYLGNLDAESRAPDFTSCDMSHDRVYGFTPREVVLHDGGNWTLRGFTYPTFWRPTQVPVRVGDRTETGLHLLQLWTRGRARNEEVLVLYPSDGYWRARPLAPAQLGWSVDPKLPTAYGSSFLIGPIADKKRPFVDIKAISFDPAPGTFELVFANGAHAAVRVSALGDERLTLEVALSAAIERGPFAALRSMYVADDNADAARVAWQEPGGKARAAPVMSFARAKASEFWAGRATPSRHNTSAPDMTFRAFRGFKSEGL